MDRQDRERRKRAMEIQDAIDEEIANNEYEYNPEATGPRSFLVLPRTRVPAVTQANTRSSPASQPKRQCGLGDNTDDVSNAHAKSTRRVQNNGVSGRSEDIPTGRSTRSSRRVPNREEHDRETTRKRSRKDLDSDSQEDEGLELVADSTRPSRKRSKRGGPGNVQDDETPRAPQGRRRKISQQAKNLAKGKVPKRGVNASPGEVKFVPDGSMLWLDPKTGKYVPAAFHKDYRDEFIRQDATKGPFKYTYNQGTSLEEWQRHWGPNKADWHNIVDSNGRKVMFETRTTKREKKPDPGNWVHNGLVILDQNRHALKNWPGLNRALSADIEGWFLDALTRVFPHITTQTDIMSRMPPTREIANGKIRALEGLTTFTNRTLRFRDSQGLLPAKKRRGGQSRRDLVDERLSRAGVSSIEDLPPPHPLELEQAKARNRGKFNNNSRYLIEEPLADERPNKKRKRAIEDAATPKDEGVKPKAKRSRAMAASTTQSRSLNSESQGQPQQGNARPLLSPVSLPFDDEMGVNKAPFASTSFDRETDSPLARDAGLTALFQNLDEEHYAAEVNHDFLDPMTLLFAQDQGDPHADDIRVHWYPANVQRAFGEDMRFHGNVAGIPEEATEGYLSGSITWEAIVLWHESRQNVSDPLLSTAHPSASPIAPAPAPAPPIAPTIPYGSTSSFAWAPSFPPSLSSNSAPQSTTATTLAPAARNPSASSSSEPSFAPPVSLTPAPHLTPFATITPTPVSRGSALPSETSAAAISASRSQRMSPGLPSGESPPSFHFCGIDSWVDEDKGW